jgi:hypothetical protein
MIIFKQVQKPRRVPSSQFSHTYRSDSEAIELKSWSIKPDKSDISVIKSPKIG